MVDTRYSYQTTTFWRCCPIPATPNWYQSKEEISTLPNAAWKNRANKTPAFAEPALYLTEEG